VLAFVDPGLAKDADCAALLADAHAGETRAPIAPAPISPISPISPLSPTSAR
jgi:hypothetical protein